MLNQDVATTSDPGDWRRRLTTCSTSSRRSATRPTWDLIGFLDDAKPLGSRLSNLEVLGPLRDAPKFAGCAFINAIGSDKNYRRWPEILASTGLPTDRFATLVHPGASVSKRARLGREVLG